MLSADVNRHFLTGYWHLHQAASFDNPLREESFYESAMVAYGLRYQGDTQFRKLQGIQEFSNYLNTYPQGSHFIRLSLHRLEFEKDLLSEKSLSDSLRSFYKKNVCAEAEKLLRDARVSLDPSVYEHVLAVITYSEVMYSFGDKTKIAPTYQERYGKYQPQDLPASTYWMFAILWGVNQLAAEDLSDWSAALQFAENQLATPPANGNAWPKGDPTHGKIIVLQKAIEYATNLGDTHKRTELEAQLEILK